MLIPVANEDQAWEALRGILDGTIDPETSQLDFSAAEWVNFHVNYKGPKLQRTLTPSLMLGIVEYQRSLYRAIALVTKGDSRITKLTDDEKDEFELLFTVEEGSTDLLAKAQEIIDAVSGKVFDNMTSAHKMICVLVIALLFFGSQGFEAYLSSSAEVRKIEAQADRDKELTEIIKGLSSERSKIVDKAAEAVPQAGEVREEAASAYDNIVRNAGGVDSITVQGVSIGSDVIQRLTQSTRRRAVKVTIKGLFTVSNVDTKTPGGFTVRFEEVNGDRNITANLNDVVLAERYKNVIERATFSKKVIKVTLSARRIGDDYLDAKVLKASTPRTTGN